MTNKTVYNKKAPFPFEYVEKLLRTKNFGIFSTVTDTGQPHSVGVVYATSPPSAHSFSLYLLSRIKLKKVKNISNNPNVSFVVPFPHYIMRMIPPACIQFSGKAKLISFEDAIARRAFQKSIVLRRSIIHNLSLGGENTFIRIIPSNKIFSFGIGASIWQILIRSRSKNLRNYYVNVPS